MNKKGISEMVSYVLLIIIAVGLSVLVFSYIRAYIPKGIAAECPDSISLALQEYQCNVATNTLEIKVVNKGLFNISAMYVRFGSSNKRILPQVNQDNLDGFYFMPALSPGMSYDSPQYPLGSQIVAGKYKVQIQPAVFDKKGKIVPCGNAILSQTIDCK